MQAETRRTIAKRLLGAIILGAGLATALGLPAWADDGITPNSIRLGATYPFTGATAVTGVMGRGVESYMKYMNSAHGGVVMADGKKRRIEFIVLDDGWDMPRVLGNVQRLVERDRVFAMAGGWGTQPNISMRPYLNEQKVPHLFPVSQATTFSVEEEMYPWTTPGWGITFSTEAAIYAEFLKKQKPNATIAILTLNVDGGREFLNSFEKALQGSTLKIVAKASYEITAASVDAEIINLARSNADVFFNISTGKHSSQSIRKVAEIGWKPLQLLIGQSSSIEGVLKPAGLENAKGIYTAAYLKDPSDSRWAKDPEMIEYRKVVEIAGGGHSPDDQFVLLGVSVGHTMVKALEASQPNRKSLVDSARNLKGVRPLGLLPEITFTTGPSDKFIIESAYLQQFNGEKWELVGEMISRETKSR